MERITSSFNDDDCLIVESRPIIKLIKPIPYRVAQKQQSPYSAVLVRACNTIIDPLAPNVLSIINSFTLIDNKEMLIQNDDIVKSLQIADEIFVNSFQSSTELVKKGYYMFNEFTCEDNVVLKSSGIVKNATIGERTNKSIEFSFVSQTPDDSRNNNDDGIYLADTKTLTEYKVPINRFSHIASSKIKPGTLVRVHHLNFPAYTRVTNSHDLILHPSCVKPNGLIMNTLPCEYRDTVRVDYIFKNDPKSYPQHMMAAVALLECIYKRDIKESIPASNFIWKFSDDYGAEVSYSSKHGIKTGPHTRKNYKNSLFLKDAIAILRKVGKNDVKSTPAHVRITGAVYKSDFTKITFQVDPSYLMKMWSIKNYQELQSGFYTLEPTNLLWYLADFIRKMIDDPKYIEKRMIQNEKQRKMLLPLLPHDNTNIRKRIFKFTDTDHSGDMSDSCLSTKQKESLNSIMEGKPFIVIDGAAKTGKTEISLYAISRLLRDKITRDSCLFFTSDHFSIEKTYKMISTSILFNDACLNKNVKILNLLGLQYADYTVENSLNNVINLLLRDRRMPIEDKTILTESKNILNSKLAPQYQSKLIEEYDNEIIEELEWELDVLTLDNDGLVVDNNNKKSRKKTTSQFITSVELEALQNTLKIIFKHYKPNFVVVDRLTLLAILPTVRSLITHLYIECAGNVPLFDVIATVTESVNLEQLIIVGDSSQCPSHRRIRLSNLPIHFRSVMNGINYNVDNVTKIQLNKTYCLNPGITSVLQQIIYPSQVLHAESTKKSIKALVKNSDYPVMFFEMRGQDELIFPTTRKNRRQSELACYLIHQILKVESDIILAVLCYYAAQVDEIRKLVGEGITKNVIITTVDSFSQDKADVTIVITTRTAESITPEYCEVFSEGQKYLKRIPASPNDIKKNICRDNYRFVFDKQRLTTALSRAERTCIIIGNSELLCNNEYWDNLLHLIYQNDNFIKEPPFLPNPDECYNIVLRDPDLDNYSHYNEIRNIPYVYLEDEPDEDIEIVKFIKKPRFQEIINY